MSKSNKSRSFNQELWDNLLVYEHQCKIDQIPITVTSISETFGLTKNHAKMYYILLTNREFMTDISTGTTLRKLKTELSDVKKDRDRQLVVVEELYNKLALVLDTKIDESKILQIEPEKYLIPKTSEIGFFSVLSDAHVEETVRPESTFGKNEYTLDIARQRLLTYFVELDEKAHKVMNWPDALPQLCIHLAGDNITGWIHPEGVETNSLSPAQAILFAEENICSGIEMLVRNNNFSDITIVCTVGNHARMTEKKRYATGWRDSLEHVMYKHIQKYIKSKYPRVNIIIAEGEFVVVNFMGKRICCSHGDHFRYAGGIGGLLVPAIRWVHKMSMILPDVDLYSIGHWHSYMALPDSKLLINGSVIGPSAFSIGLAFKPEPPKMQLQYINSKNGFTVNDPIFLE